MNLLFKRKLSNQIWEDTDITIENDKIDLRCTDTGYFQLNHEEFDEIINIVKHYREAAKTLNIEIK